MRNRLSDPQLPDRTGHREGQLLAIGRPCGPSRRASRGRDIVIVLVSARMAQTGSGSQRWNKQKKVSPQYSNLSPNCICRFGLAVLVTWPVPVPIVAPGGLKAGVFVELYISHRNCTRLLSLRREITKIRGSASEYFDHRGPGGPARTRSRTRPRGRPTGLLQEL